MMSPSESYPTLSLSLFPSKILMNGFPLLRNCEESIAVCAGKVSLNSEASDAASFRPNPSVCTVGNVANFAAGAASRCVVSGNPT